MDNILNLIGRTKEILRSDIDHYSEILSEKINHSNFLVIGGAGSIGQAVTKEIFLRNPKKLHVVDISENNMVELVRDIRSSAGYIDGDFKTFAIDCGSQEFESMYANEGPYDYVLNLSALKHVRSEKDPYTLMRMVRVNILNTLTTVNLAIKHGAKKYFCVSTDKAANPVNMMGASKRIMEMFLMQKSREICISTARFANVAFSDGSLLFGFDKRLQKKQPISAPKDVRRYFVTPKEAGELCLMSTMLGENRDIFFPKLSQELNLVTFSSIARRYLENRKLKPIMCSSEEEARSLSLSNINTDSWPCYFFKSDTTGEKDFEEFFTENESLDLERFDTLGVVKNNQLYEDALLQEFIHELDSLLSRGAGVRKKILELFIALLPSFRHKETGRYLDGRM